MWLPLFAAWKRRGGRRGYLTYDHQDYLGSLGITPEHYQWDESHIAWVIVW
ncbi:hypothetical protein [Spartinivicinus ruber]|uniref:hypothetical protein n=1 Tax=Spartinivicinus ruber TaxID=2683272 RepID=UPI0013D0DE20|nr:hypothetical protein [Spartinivicinus ruber]